MNKLLKSILLITTLTLSSVCYADDAPLSCTDLNGNWSGHFAPFDYINMNLNNYYKDMVFARIDYSERNGSLHDGANNVPGTCQMNADGTITAHFHDEIPGLSSIDYTVQLTSKDHIIAQGHIWTSQVSGDLYRTE